MQYRNISRLVEQFFCNFNCDLYNIELYFIVWYFYQSILFVLIIVYYLSAFDKEWIDSL